MSDAKNTTFADLITITPKTPGALVSADIVRDTHFYFRNVVICAGKTHFRVPVYGLPKGNDNFNAIFAEPSKGDEGSSDENPIRLSTDVSAKAFRSLLKVIFPLLSSQTSQEIYFDDWMLVLKLANKWQLHELCMKAIVWTTKKIKALDPVTKVLLGKEYMVSSWLIDGYEELGKRKQHITEGERDKLGIETAFRILILREKSWAWFTSLPLAPTPQAKQISTVASTGLMSQSSTTSTSIAVSQQTKPETATGQFIPFEDFSSPATSSVATTTPTFAARRENFNYRVTIHEIFKDELIHFGN